MYLFLIALLWVEKNQKSSKTLQVHSWGKAVTVLTLKIIYWHISLTEKKMHTSSLDLMHIFSMWLFISFRSIYQLEFRAALNSGQRDGTEICRAIGDIETQVLQVESISPPYMSHIHGDWAPQAKWTLLETLQLCGYKPVDAVIM